MKMTSGQEVERIETRLRQLGTKLDRLAAQAGEAGADAQLAYREQIDHIKDKHTMVRDKLRAFRAANGQKWDSFRGSVEVAWQELEYAVKALRQGPAAPVPPDAEATRQRLD
jgi:hypothetical protein